MNVKKIDENNRLLSIDDPSIYISNISDASIKVIINNNVQEELPAEIAKDVLYLKKESDAEGVDGLYKTYVRGSDGTPVIAPNPLSTGPTLPYATLSGDGNIKIQQLNDNLVAIDKHLYALRKELSYWNLYQISYSVDRAQDFSVILASLSPGEALIINAEGQFNYGDITYKRGDMVARLSNGQYITIESSTAGFYYPKQITADGNNYTLYYGYAAQEETPRAGSTEVLSSTPISKPAETETITLSGASPSNSFVYGLRKEKGDFTTVNNNYVLTFSVYTITIDGITYTIPPVIKFFTTDGEEISLTWDCILINSNTEWQLTVSSAPSAWKYTYIK